MPGFNRKWLLWFLLVFLPGKPILADPTATIVVGPDLESGANPTATPLATPFGVDFDAAGNMYIVELDGGRVHRLAPDGGFATIAGNGQTGYTGDGGPARDATFNGMHNIAALPDGTLFIADSWNHCVRRIDSRGTISTIAGTGQAGFSGDGGPAVNAAFDFLMCVSLNPDGDALYVADLRNRRIRRIDLGSGIVSTVAGNGERGVPADGALAVESPLVDPRAVAVDRLGNVYVLERGGHALRAVGPDGRIRTVAGTGTAGGDDGPALEASLNSPKHLAVDHEGSVLIADDVNARIRRYDPRAGRVTTILGADVDTRPPRTLSHPHGVTVHPDHSIFVVDTMHHRILRLTE